MRIELGSTCRDIITGFEGVVIARTEWLTGCARVTLQPRALHEGKPVESQCFDEAQVDVIDTQERLVFPPNEDGGPRPAPSRHRDPTRR